MRCLVVALLPAALSLMDDGAAFDGVAAFDDAVDPGALCLARGLAGPACLEVLGGVEDSVAACACFGGVVRRAPAAPAPRVPRAAVDARGRGGRRADAAPAVRRRREAEIRAALRRGRRRPALRRMRPKRGLGVQKKKRPSEHLCPLGRRVARDERHRRCRERLVPAVAAAHRRTTATPGRALRRPAPASHRAPAGVVRGAAPPAADETPPRDRLRGASALEIGGPSDLFEGAEGGRFAGFGLYPVVSRLDNVEFAQTTAWSVDDGGNARRRALYSASFVAEASTLVGVDSLYGAVLASHVLEHVADPISALRRWAARLEAAGLLVLVLPERRGTFDVYRNSTRLETLDDRCGRRAAEDDLSSLADVLGGLPLQGDDFERFARGALANAQSRTLHHSVFDLDLVRRLVENCVGGLRLVSEFVAEPFHLVAVYQRTADAQMPLLETHRQLDRTSCCLDLY